MAFLPIKEYKITLTAATASTAVQLVSASGELDQSQYWQARISCPLDVVVKFGDSSVTASSTVTSSALADGNFTVYGGAGPEAFDLKQPLAYRYVSAICPSGTTLTVTLGYNEP